MRIQHFVGVVAMLTAHVAHANEFGDVTRPARNPFLSSTTYGVTHFDPAQTDAMPYPAPMGTFNINLEKFSRVVGGPVNIMQLASTSPKYMWGASSGGVRYIDVSKGRFRAVAELDSPGTKNISAQTLDKVFTQRFTDLAQVEKAVEELGVNWERIANNVYAIVDSDNVLYAGSKDKIVAYGLVNPKKPSAGIKVLRTLDFTGTLSELRDRGNPMIAQYGAWIIGANLTYDGKLIVLTNASITVMDRSLTGPQHTFYFGKDEFVSNSIAVDEKNGIYVASDKLMRKLVWTGSKLSADEADGAWSAPYETGREMPSVKFGIGTGSTPTLMGFGDDEDKLVVITDGADRMNLVAFWREAIPAGGSSRLAGQIPVTCGLSPLPEFIQSEQSVVVKGYGAFVVNNIRPEGNKDKLVDVIAGGPVFAPPAGVERFEWDTKTHAWRSAWSRSDVVSTSMVPSVSIPSNIVFTNGYNVAKGWDLIGMDWDTGKTVHSTTFGHGSLGNGAYAIIQFMPDGDLLFNSIAGPTRVKFTNKE